MIRFGTGGWRALVESDFTKENVRQLTRALARLMLDSGASEKGLCIGYDHRRMSRAAAEWAAEVMAGAGVSCMVFDRATPPSQVMFAVKQLGLNYGMAITASHNSDEFNGVKVFTAGGYDAEKRVTDEIAIYLKELADTPVDGIDYSRGVAGGLIARIDTLGEYIDSIMGLVDADTIRRSGIKTAVASTDGTVGQDTLQRLLLAVGCEPELLPVGVPEQTGPNEYGNKVLRERIGSRYDIGITIDGDTDRMGVVDDCGRPIHPNTLLALLYYYLLRYRGMRGSAVRSVTGTHMLDRIAESFGERCYEVPVGFRCISAKMRETNAVIGGESLGGVVVRGHIPGKDGIFTALLLAEMVAVTGKPLSSLERELEEQYGRLCGCEKECVIDAERCRELIEVIFRDKRLPDFALAIKKVSYLDGCKVTFENGGWVAARLSGTEPLARICSEMPTRQEAERVAALLRDHLGLREER